jgi:hypothetical protein
MKHWMLQLFLPLIPLQKLQQMQESFKRYKGSQEPQLMDQTKEL